MKWNWEDMLIKTTTTKHVLCFNFDLSWQNTNSHCRCLHLKPDVNGPLKLYLVMTFYTCLLQASNDSHTEDHEPGVQSVWWLSWWQRQDVRPAETLRCQVRSNGANIGCTCICE